MFLFVGLSFVSIKSLKKYEIPYSNVHLDAADISSSKKILPKVPSCCCLLGQKLCKSFEYNPAIMILSVWCCLNMVWECILLLVHLIFISRNLTTNEVISMFRNLRSRRDGILHEGRNMRIDKCFRKWRLVYEQNPHDRGCLKNIYHFLTGKPLYKPGEWYSMYEIYPFNDV
jgi:hypothetical protein